MDTQTHTCRDIDRKIHRDAYMHNEAQSKENNKVIQYQRERRQGQRQKRKKMEKEKRQINRKYRKDECDWMLITTLALGVEK